MNQQAIKNRFVPFAISKIISAYSGIILFRGLSSQKSKNIEKKSLTFTVFPQFKKLFLCKYRFTTSWIRYICRGRCYYGRKHHSMMTPIRSVVFRVDGGNLPGISFGHIFRCLALAEELSKKNVKCIFVMRNYDESVNLVTKKGFDVIPLPRHVSENEDRVLTADIVRKSNSKKVIFDLPAICQAYLASLPASVYSIVLDDTGQKAIQPNLLINGSLVETFQTYPKSPGTQFLIGPEYNILGQHFNHLPKHRIQKDVQIISIFFGGSDPTNLTTKVLQSLQHSLYTCTFQVIIGPGFQHISELSRQIEGFPGEIIVKQHVKNMAWHFLHSDIAITAGGLTLYELAATGTPGICIPSIAHEHATAEAFQRLNILKNLGMWTDDHARFLPEALKALILDYDLRQQMSQSGQATIDGKGCQRVIAQIL